MEGQMRRREKGYTYQLPFQNGFWKLPQNISACISLARSFLVTWPHLAARKARKYCLYSRWPNAHSESELLVLREKGSVDIGTQKFLSPSETFASEMVQGTIMVFSETKNTVPQEEWEGDLLYIILHYFNFITMLM